MKAYLATLLTATGAVGVFHFQQRAWFCFCGQWHLWIGDAWGKHTSQHLFDPYSFTHLLHGFIFCWLLTYFWPKLSAAWAFLIAIAVEAGWEAFENTQFVIERYRQTTASVEYQGDTIINSIGDTIACGLGFLIAKRIGFRRSLALYVIVEIVLLFAIRDSLTLTVVMLAWPFEFLKQWQAAGH